MNPNLHHCCFMMPSASTTCASVIAAIVLGYSMTSISASPRAPGFGFVGRTGSGKSTVLDLLMGLLEPNEGQILVDGQPISGNRLRAWQRGIAHVPQSIYLADTTLAENIAFGVPRDAIDMQRVQQAGRQAQIADFIESSPEGYQAYVGESKASVSPAANANASALPAHSTNRPTCWCSTKPPAPSTTPPNSR